MNTSLIPWTNVTWNPWLGCGDKSPACVNCYAKLESWMKTHNPRTPQFIGTVEKRGDVIRWTGLILPNSEAQITKPRDISEPVLIFTCSLSDFWHEHVPFALRKRVVAIIEATPRHSYQVLTKRPELIAGHLARLRWTLPEHVWLGATVENRATLWRIDALRAIPAAIRFLSIEPLLEPLGRLDCVASTGRLSASRAPQRISCGRATGTGRATSATSARRQAFPSS